MCEFCGHAGVCAVCGWDQDTVPLVGWTGDGEEGVFNRGGRIPRGWGSADTSIEDDDGGSREELRVLDASLSLDAELCAGVAVREFAERLGTDVVYALNQLAGCSRHQGMESVMDRVRRALDALGRLEGRIGAVTAGCAGV